MSLNEIVSSIYEQLAESETKEDYLNDILSNLGFSTDNTLNEVRIYLENTNHFNIQRHPKGRCFVQIRHEGIEYFNNLESRKERAERKEETEKKRLEEIKINIEKNEHQISVLKDQQLIMWLSFGVSLLALAKSFGII